MTAAVRDVACLDTVVETVPSLDGPFGAERRVVTPDAAIDGRVVGLHEPAPGDAHRAVAVQYGR